jgi:ribosome-binding protein aMBF1 (putative translation factor)
VTASKSTELIVGQVVAANMRRLMEAQGMSKEDLARKAGHSLTCVEEFLSGKAEEKSRLLALQDFADALGVLAMDLVRSAPKEV